MKKYKNKIEQKVIDLTDMYNRHERMKYKTHLYAHCIDSKISVNQLMLEAKQRELTEHEKQLGNNLHKMIEVAEHCIALLEWYENDREAIINKLHSVNKNN